MPADAPLFTRPFVITCLATFFFYLSFYLILPVMPLYVAGMGGTSTQLGLIIGLFAFMAMVLRPPAGWIIDTRGSFLVLVVGVAIFFLASLGYVLARSVEAILALRLFHGMGMGLFPTAATVVVAEVAPLPRRGEAMGWFGIANSVGLVFGPAAGTIVSNRMGFPVLFLLAGAVALLGLACLAMLPRIGKPSGRTGQPPTSRSAATRRRAAARSSVTSMGQVKSPSRRSATTIGPGGPSGSSTTIASTSSNGTVLTARNIAAGPRRNRI